MALRYPKRVYMRLESSRGPHTEIADRADYTLKVVAFGKWVINFEIAERSQTEVADPLSHSYRW